MWGGTTGCFVRGCMPAPACLLLYTNVATGSAVTHLTCSTMDQAFSDLSALMAKAQVCGLAPALWSSSRVWLSLQFGVHNQ